MHTRATPCRELVSGRCDGDTGEPARAWQAHLGVSSLGSTSATEPLLQQQLARALRRHGRAGAGARAEAQAGTQASSVTAEATGSHGHRVAARATVTVTVT